MNINVFNIIILVGIIQGIIFSLILLVSKKFNHTVANRYMAIVVLCFSLTNLQSWFIDSQIIKEVPEIILYYLPWEMLCPPAFYMFTVRYLDYKEKNKFSRLLYVPFAVYLVIYIYFKIDFIFLDQTRDIIALGKKPIFYIEQLLIVPFTLLNGYFVYRILKKCKRNISSISDVQGIDFAWYTTVFRTLILLCVFLAITVVFQILAKSPFGLYAYYPTWIGFTCFTYWIGYSGIFKLKTRKRHVKPIDTKTTNQIKRLLNKENLTHDFKLQKNDVMYTENAHFEKFVKLLRTEKIHLNPSLNLEVVAEKLNISANYLSQIINKNSGATFCEIIGKLRVEEIKEMLNSSQYEKYTLLSIGLEAGFNSKSVFYRTFKKFTSMTPSEYKDKLVYNIYASE